MNFWHALTARIMAYDAWIISTAAPRTGHRTINPQWALDWVTQWSSYTATDEIIEFLHDSASLTLDEIKSKHAEFYAYHQTRQATYTEQCIRGHNTAVIRKQKGSSR